LGLGPRTPAERRTPLKPRTAERSDLLALRTYNRKLIRLAGLTAEIAKLGDERATLRKIVDTAASLVGVESAHLALVDRGERMLFGVASSGRHRPGARGLRVELSKSAAAHEALQTRKPVIVERARQDARVNRRARKILSIGAIVYLPLLSGRQSFGLLILVTRTPHAWSRQEVALARRFADIAAVALENVRLLGRLAATEARFRSLVEHIPAVVYTCEVEPPYKTIYISPQTETMLGYSPEEWLEDGRFFMKLIHPTDLDAHVAHWSAAARTVGFVTSDYRLRDRRGELRWFRDEAVLVRDPAGAPIAWHGVMVEITGLKKMEQDFTRSLPQGSSAARLPSPEPRPSGN